MYLKENIAPLLEQWVSNQVIETLEFDILLMLTEEKAQWEFSRFALETDITETPNASEINKELLIHKHVMAFPDTVCGNETILRLDPSVENAGKFWVKNDSDVHTKVSILEDSILLYAGQDVGPEEQIKVDSWCFNGVGMERDGLHRNCGDRLPIGELGVGAVARVNSYNKPGVYIGTATLRVIFS